jgi:hypothetical protein
MRSFVLAIAPMFAFYLIPIAIPIVAVALGAVTDGVRPHRASAAEAAVIAAQARSAPWRAEMARLLREASVADSAGLPSGQQVSAKVPSVRSTGDSRHGHHGGRTAA